jgi:dihydrofolate synthase / folylpolyglutamate synthase
MAARGSETLSALAPTAATPLREWLAWLEAGRGEHIVLGLERCAEVAKRLALARPAPVVVTVAGTNGKGSSVALLASIWASAGYRVGTYTSPHLLRYNERIRIDGIAVDDTGISHAFARVEAARGNVALTYFEFGTLAALSIFAENTLDVVILEVGLGGRLDAVNIIDADVALIAAIGLDHEEWLGNSREKIAIEKAGIMRAGRVAVCSDNDLPPTMLEHAQTCGASPAVLGVDYAFEDEGQHWTWWSGQRVLENLPYPALSGAHQLRNAAGVLKVIDTLQPRLPVANAQIAQGLCGVVLPGRFHRVTGPIEYVLDVAHNPQAAEIFTATLATMPPAPRTHALIGMLNTKNHRGFLAPLLDHVHCWHFVSLGGANGARAEALARCLGELAPRAVAHCHSSVAAGHNAVLAEAGTGDRVLVLGSFLTVGAMFEQLALSPATP